MSVALPRSAWGARQPKCRNLLRLPTPELFVHHEGSTYDRATSDSLDRQREITTMRAIQADHMDNRGWCDIAYSFVVFPSGRAYEGRGWGVAGGATFGHNQSSHAICWAGNMMVQQPTQASLGTGRALILEGEGQGYLSVPSILGHRDASGGYPQNQTQCPGDHLEARLDYLRTGGQDMTLDEIAQGFGFTNAAAMADRLAFLKGHHDADDHRPENPGGAKSYKEGFAHVGTSEQGGPGGYVKHHHGTDEGTP